jgi:HEAT repeat protein
MKHLCFAILLLAGTAFAREDHLLAILRSDAPTREKSDACRELARIGTREAVPVLAPLLADEKLSDMARFALEPIPDPAVDKALREALGKVSGRLLVGVISSVGVRKDPAAVAPLGELLTDPDSHVMQAAARALGNFGSAAVPVLAGVLSTPSAANQVAVCEGLLGCAEAAPAGESTAIYDKLRALPKLPLHLRVAVLRGSIRSRGNMGLPLLAEAIRSESYVPAVNAIGIAMELPGTDVTRVLVGELAAATEPKQILLLQALGSRGDAAAAPALVPLVRSGSVERRIAALDGLVQLACPSSIPVLAALVPDPEAAVSNAALAGLSGFPGQQADAALLALLDGAPPNVRIALIQAFGQRRMTAAIPILSREATATDAGVAQASLKVLRALEGKTDEDFTRIFNGQNLTGWNGKPGWWKVEDGALTAESTPENPCKECNYLIWRGDHPADFELLADFKLSSDANSGIQLRSQELLNWDTFGYQADMTGDGSLLGFVYHHQYGLIAGRGEKSNFAADGTKTVEPLGDPAELLKHFKPGGWNSYRIICRGPGISLFVNGVLMCQITDHRVKPAATHGIIALQMHPGPPMKIQFKNIRIKQLPTEDAAPHN